MLPSQQLTSIMGHELTSIMGHSTSLLMYILYLPLYKRHILTLFNEE